MTREERRHKFNWFLFMLGYFSCGYLTINWISSQRTSFFNVAFGWEKTIPFIPAFIFGYILVYLSILLAYIVFCRMEDWRRVVVAFLLSTTLAYIVFLIFPVRMTMRPDLAGLTGISTMVTRLYYIIDMPYNCFPSLHVTYPTLATLVAWRNHRIMRWVFLAMALVVAISVVIVKQHYVADVVGGFVNAAFCFWLTLKVENYRPKARRRV
jgi:membrane-associated phospholipid phosphatase